MGRQHLALGPARRTTQPHHLPSPGRHHRPGHPQRLRPPYAYVITADSRLWCSWWDGSTWHWADHGTPPGQPVKKGAGFITVQDTPTAAQRPYVFVQGYDSKLYLNWWDGSTWHWSAQGTPSGRLILDSVGAITVRDAPTAAQRPYAFVIGDDSKFYANWWDGSTWKWADHGTATGRVLERPGELTVQDKMRWLGLILNAAYRRTRAGGPNESQPGRRAPTQSTMRSGDRLNINSYILGRVGR
ncbi:hypothetical protein [Streptomyces coeruleorubidus]|uniref:hypothetical protein n=1 Tax=Streptomyces coeruleorubidus TaxID=116188 RepID=UPI0033B9D963